MRDGQKISDPLFEKLADIEHERWSDWMKSFFEKCWKLPEAEEQKEKNVVHIAIPKSDYERWQRQMKADYDQLSESEKDSDRDQVMRYWHLIN